MEQKPFGRLRELVWPVYTAELRKLLPMLGLFFLIAFAYNILRPLKSSITVTLQDAKAEVVPFLKVYAVLPGAILITFVYTFLSNHLNREKVFYAIVSLFMLFFFCFIAFIYPNLEYLRLDSVARSLQHLTINFYFFQLPIPTGLISMLQNWHISLFYVSVELWSTTVLSMLFWGFVNEVCHISEAKRFYVILALFANISASASSIISDKISKLPYLPNFPLGLDPTEQNVDIAICLFLLTSLCIMLLLRWMNTKRKDVFHEVEDSVLSVKKPKPKMSLVECFRYVSASSYLTKVAIVVFAFNFVYNLTDIILLDIVEKAFPDTNANTSYMSKIQFSIGVMSTLLAILTNYIVRRYGWTVTAILTPIIVGVTIVVFFYLIIFKDVSFTTYLVTNLSFIFGNSVLFLTLIVGSIQKILIRSCKFSLFDSSKEMAYVPISTEGKRKGKAAIDGIGSRLGKSGGSIAMQILLIFHTISSSTPYVAVLIIIAIAAWLLCIKMLGKSIDLHDNSEKHLI